MVCIKCCALITQIVGENCYEDQTILSDDFPDNAQQRPQLFIILLKATVIVLFQSSIQPVIFFNILNSESLLDRHLNLIKLGKLIKFCQSTMQVFRRTTKCNNKSCLSLTYRYDMVLFLCNKHCKHFMFTCFVFF